MKQPMIATYNLSYTYQTGNQIRKALVDVNVEIPAGSCVAIIGVTGSGKTTLIQHFNGLLLPTAGTVLVDGVNVGAKGTDLRALRQRVGMLFQFPENQLFERTVFEDVAFGPRRMGLDRREVRRRVLEALQSVGLPHQEYGWRSPFDLSGGQRRRIALAGVLSMSPRVLILDEPTAGLDADSRAEFYMYLHQIQREQAVTILLVSHDMTEVAALAEQIFVLHHGKLVMQGTPRELFAEGEQLRGWGLAAPPLGLLLERLRAEGMPIPREIFTLEEAFSWLQKQSGDLLSEERKSRC